MIAGVEQDVPAIAQVSSAASARARVEEHDRRDSPAQSATRRATTQIQPRLRTRAGPPRAPRGRATTDDRRPHRRATGIGRRSHRRARRAVSRTWRRDREDDLARAQGDCGSRR